MLFLRHDALEFRFPDVHPDAAFHIALQRTLRIPDDGRDYPLPAGLGRFPMRHVDDFADRIPADWRRRGGVMVPMWQAEALWIDFNGRYPCAVKIAAGMRSAVTGDPWKDGLGCDPQDYAVFPVQPWLDGFCVGEDTIRQFVAMPLGQGYSVEEQLSGQAGFGGLQIEVFPMKAARYAEYFPPQPPPSFSDEAEAPYIAYCMAQPSSPAMGLGAGGRMQQTIYADPYEPDDWDLDHGQRCFIHLCNSAMWQAVTGEPPPTLPPTSREYADAGLPWFEYYAEGSAVAGGAALRGVKSVKQLGDDTGETPLPENDGVMPVATIPLGRKDGEVRVGEF